MSNTFSILADDELIGRYAAYKHGEIQFTDDELQELEEELATRRPNSEDALKLLDLLRGKL